MAEGRWKVWLAEVRAGFPRGRGKRRPGRARSPGQGWDRPDAGGATVRGLAAPLIAAGAPGNCGGGAAGTLSVAGRHRYLFGGGGAAAAPREARSGGQNLSRII